MFLVKPLFVQQANPVGTLQKEKAVDLEKQLSETKPLSHCCAPRGGAQTITAVEVFSECLIFLLALLSPRRHKRAGWALFWLMPQKQNCLQCFDGELTLICKICSRKGPA